LLSILAEFCVSYVVEMNYAKNDATQTVVKLERGVVDYMR